jgi:hypothetical protein
LAPAFTWSSHDQVSGSLFTSQCGMAHFTGEPMTQRHGRMSTDWKSFASW